MRPPRVAPDLRPGEQVLYEGRPRGASPLVQGGELLFYVNWAAAAVLFAVLWAALLRKPVLWRPGALLPPPSPLMLLPLAGALLLWQVASWRARRYVLTDQRLLVIDGVVRPRALAFERTGRERVDRRLDGVLEVVGLAPEPIRLPGLDPTEDLENLRAALARSSDA